MITNPPLMSSTVAEPGHRTSSRKLTSGVAGRHGRRLPAAGLLHLDCLSGVVQRVPVSVPAAPPGAAAGSAVASTTKPGELAVRETARQLAAASISDNTQRAYAGAMRRLKQHLDGAELTDATLADYLAHLFEIGRSPASAAMVVAAVRFQVRVTGSDSPVGAATDRVLAGFRRAGSDRGRGQVAGVRWGQADAAAAVAGNGGESIHGLRDAAILAVASDAMLRVSELAALRVGDIGAGEDNAATVTVRHSKTDQEGEGAVLFLGPSTAARISAWLAAAGVSTDDTNAPLFQRIDRGGTPRGQLSARSVRRIITARCSAAGVEGRISGHSLRVGSAQSLAAAGAGLVEMQQAGRWQSPTMPARYAAGELAARGAVARLRYGTAK